MANTSLIRPTAVAGSFYPSQPQELKQQVNAFLNPAGKTVKKPRALIVPHAGYIYSGSIAGAAYSLLIDYAHTINNVILLGPSHHVGFQGLAGSHFTRFSTPLGEIPLDIETLNKLERLPQVSLLNEAHELEHSLEVQLPFLQEVLGHFLLSPLVVGQCNKQAVAEVIEAVSDIPNSLIIISTDLSHFHKYEVCQHLDGQTSVDILQLHSQLNGEQACGCKALNGLLFWAKQQGLHIELIDLKNSGDSAGPKERVVGYGAYALYDSNSSSSVAS